MKKTITENDLLLFLHKILLKLMRTTSGFIHTSLTSTSCMCSLSHILIPVNHIKHFFIINFKAMKLLKPVFVLHVQGGAK